MLPWQPNLPKNNKNIKLVFIVLGKYNFVYRSIWKLVLIKIIQSKKRPQNISSFITTVGYFWSGKPCILVSLDRLVLHKCISEKKLRPIIYFFVTIKSDGLSSKLRKNNCLVFLSVLFCCCCWPPIQILYYEAFYPFLQLGFGPKRSVKFRMNFWGHRFSQNSNQKLQGFLPYQTNKDRM